VFAYDDLREHRLEGTQALTDEARDILERSVLFIRTEIESAAQELRESDRLVQTRLGSECKRCQRQLAQRAEHHTIRQPTTGTPLRLGLSMACKVAELSKAV
jgi:hypothetical protein